MERSRWGSFGLNIGTIGNMKKRGRQLGEKRIVLGGHSYTTCDWGAQGGGRAL